MMDGKRVLIIGLGLIGGSIALAIKKGHPDTTIVGYDLTDNKQQLSKSLGVIDEVCGSFQEEMEAASLIVIATPVLQTEQLLETVASYTLQDDVLITDVGSTKRSIVQKAADVLPAHVAFIGGHPMAGSHKTGPAAARAHLFENAFYILTPSDDLAREKVPVLKAWLQETKATFIEMDALAHDEMVGVISHFPHVIASGLVHELDQKDQDTGLIARFAAGGFKDITRIASSSPVMWRDITLDNRDVLLGLLDSWQEQMTRIRAAIDQKDDAAIYRFFESAKAFRDRLPERSQGAIPAFYDLFVDIEDHPGVIAHITGILSHRDISITNIEIIETREDILGVLRLSFRNEKDRTKAEALLNEYSYETYLVD